MTDSKHLIIEMMTLNTQNKTKKKSVILFISSLSSRALISEIVSTKWIKRDLELPFYLSTNNARFN